jgi:hypothetical protein
VAERPRPYRGSEGFFGFFFTHVLIPSLKQLMAVGVECKQKKGAPPNLIVVVLPEGGNDIYTAVKQYVYFHILELLFLLSCFLVSVMSRLALNPSDVLIVLLMEYVIDGRGNPVHEKREVLPRETSILRERVSEVSWAYNVHV